MSRPDRSAALDWIVLAAMTASWGSAFAALRIAVAEIDPAWNTAFRLVIATTVLGIAAAAMRQRLPRLLPPDAAWGWYAVSGIGGMALPFLLFAYASTALPSAVTAICNGATPIFVAVLAHFAIGERLTLRRAAGVGLGFTGLVVLVGGGAVREVGETHLLALSAALGGAVLYALSGVSIRRAPALPSLTGALLVCLTGAVAAVPMALLIGGPPPTAASGRTIAAVLFLGLAPTAAAMIGWVWLTQRRGALFASMGTYAAPLFATGLGVVLLDERLPPEAFAALALVVGGMIVANTGGRPRAADIGPGTVDAPPTKDP